MSESASGARVVGRTRWRRFGIAAGAGLGALGIVGYLAASGAFALSFAFSGIPFTLSATSLTGNNFVQYAYPDHVASNPGSALQNGAAQLLGKSGTINNVLPDGGNGAYVSDTVSQFRTATIAGLNQRVCAPLPAPLPSMQVVIAGTGNATQASNLTIQAPALTASTADFNKIIIGQSLGDALSSKGFAPNNDFTDPYGAQGNATLGGSFAQSANSVTLKNINQIGIGTEAGSFAIDGLQLYAEFVSSC